MSKSTLPPAAVAVAWVRARLDEGSVLWRRSLQLRVVVSTFALSAVVLLVLGLVLQAQITDGLLEAQTRAALEQTRNSQRIVESELAGVDPATDELSGRLNSALNRLASSQPESDSGDSAAAEAGLFTSVLVDGGATRNADFADPPYSGPINDVPVELRVTVQQGKFAHKIATLHRKEGPETVIAVGVPVASAGRPLQLYLLFPLSAHQQTLALVQSTLLAGGALLTLLLAGIAGLVTRQVVQPVRQAAEVAERFASGHLDERMPVTGEDDMARLAVSFNEMAGSIQHQIHKLEEFGTLQRRFTSDVSHELRTPLTTVRMAADVLHGARHEFPPGLRRSTELMVDELDRFEVLLVDLLEISRLDAGVAELALEQVDARSVVRNAVESIHGLAASSGTAIELVMPDEEVYAEVDPRRIGRILRNLLVNALDYGEGRPVHVRLGGSDDAIAIVVRDHGVGLAAGEDELVFNRFWRADPSRNRRTGGTGLGLAISLEDARLHGGWLQAWGRSGAGAVFRLTLPRRQGVRLDRSPLPLAPDGIGERGEPPAPSAAGRPAPAPAEPSARRPPMAGVSGEAE
jgi:two-component system sensor histidine kinase MtrB